MPINRYMVKKMWCVYTHTHTHTHTGILFSHKKEKILSSAATWMDMRGITSAKSVR